MRVFKNFLNLSSEKIKDVNVDHVKAVAQSAKKGAAAVAGRVMETGSDTLDALTRKNTDNEVREHILLQSRYNDIIAVKLEEALKRIDALEKKLESK